MSGPLPFSARVARAIRLVHEGQVDGALALSYVVWGKDAPSLADIELAVEFVKRRAEREAA